MEYEGFTFQADKIKSGNVYLATSLLSSSLEVNSLIVEVECSDPSILNFRRNAKLLYYAKPDQPMTFRVQNIERVAPKLYRVTATSTLGLLSEGLHYGGMYTGETLDAILKEICGEVPFIVRGNIRDMKLYGWLPIAAPRDNLAQVLFAAGASLKTDLDGVLRIENYWDGVSWSVDADRIYQESTVGYSAAVTGVSVTEHQYIKGAEEKNLFEGTALSGDIITFSEPMHDLKADGFSILDSGANWAKLSAGTGTLTGKVYIHTTREVTREVQSAQEPNIKSVKDVTLISLVNSAAAANRLANFYKWRETINAPVVYQGESPGDRISVFHPFDRVDAVSCLQSVDITLSNTLKATEKSLVGFVPEQVEEFETYDQREVLTESGYWIVPKGVNSIRVVLIGGGQGGYSGKRGNNGSSGSGGFAGGDGGDGGDAGHGGKVYQETIEVTPGDRYQVVVGKGGAGGQYSSSGSIAGSDGDESFFGNLSSDAGSASAGGFIDVITQEAYATSGVPGVVGGKGGKGGTSSASGAVGGMYVISPTDDSIRWLGGYPGVSKAGGDGFSAYSGGGGGGGAAIGVSGGNGSDCVLEGWDKRAYGGSGGTGASARAPEKTRIRGGGGQGGNGGGGGGGAANGATSINAPGSAGYGGNGSSGGEGGDGVVILYYGVKKKKQSGQFQDRLGRSALDKHQRRFIV